MATWDVIRAARKDMTDHVVHLTRLVVDKDDGKKEVAQPKDRLKQILKCGYLLPSFAPRETVRGNRNRTVKGPHKCVCFSAQPLEQIPVTLDHTCSYGGYGIALNMVDLYEYGGRPVIYGDESVLDCLSDEKKYLWVRYRPVRPGRNYPNDFTFEREWRSRVWHERWFPWQHELKGVPLLLPDDFRRVASLSSADKWFFKKTRAPDFRIIVRWDVDVKELREFVQKLALAPSKSTYRRIYYASLSRVQIISLEHIERRVGQDNEQFRRIEDLPRPQVRQNIAPKNPKKKTWKFLRKASN